MELKEYRITADDGKTLMSFQSDVDENLSNELKEQVLKCIHMFCREAVEQYGKRILVLYESNADQNKRMHTISLRCEITVLALMKEDEQVAILYTVFRKGTKKIFDLEQKVFYETNRKLFYMG